MTLSRKLLLACLAGALSSCTSGASKDGGAEVLALVNGQPLKEVDLELALRREPRPAAANPQHRKDVLEGLIRDELMAAKAKELGLDKDPGYLAEVEKQEAQLAAVKRAALAETFRRTQISEKAKPSDAMAKAFYDANLTQIRTQVHVLQLQTRTEEAIVALKAAIDSGRPFEEVAKSQFPVLPDPARPPWDLGYIRWGQFPEAWQPVLSSLKDGEVSPIIRGGKNRFWILKVVERREDPQATFELVKPTIVETLRSARQAELSEQVASELRAKAKVVYEKPIPAGPAPVAAPEE